MTAIPLARILAAGYRAWPTSAVNTRRLRVATHIIPPDAEVALCGLRSAWARECELGDGSATCRRCCERFTRAMAA